MAILPIFRKRETTPPVSPRELYVQCPEVGTRIGVNLQLVDVRKKKVIVHSVTKGPAMEAGAAAKDILVTVEGIPVKDAYHGQQIISMNVLQRQAAAKVSTGGEKSKAMEPIRLTLVPSENTPFADGESCRELQAVQVL